MRLMLLVGAMLASLAALPVAEARADAQLQVTARVVNRCTVELPDRPPWSNPGQGWRKWLEHRCDHPVHPQVSVGPAAARPEVVAAGAPGQAQVTRGRAVNHWVITITY